MNLESYQEFHKTIQDFNLMIEQEALPKMVSRTTTGKQISETKTDRETFIRNAKTCKQILPQATIFELDEDTIKLCLNTKIPINKEKYEFLPHPIIFLDLTLNQQEHKIFDNKITGMLITERPLVDMKAQSTVGKAIGVWMIVISPDKHIILESVSFNEKITKPDKQHMKITKTSLPTSKTVERFIRNFLNFINDPEVSFITHKRDTKNQERRIRQGKLLLPDSKLIKITGELKIYIDEAKKKGGGWHYNFRFPVRSHIRRYRDETGNVTKEIKIPRFYKGHGILIDRTYKVEQRNETNEEFET